MYGVSTWLADRVASLLPQTLLPQSSVAACTPFSICSWASPCGSRTLFACCSRHGFVSCVNQGTCC